MDNNKTKVKQKAGRKSKYHTHVEPNLEIIKKLRRDGATEEQLAKRFKCGYSSWRSYKKLFPAFAAALQEEGEYMLAKTEKSLYNTAWGYTQKQVKEIFELDRRTGKLLLIRKEISPDKIILGNVNAQKFLLSNLSPEKWVDRRTVDTSVNNLEELKAIADTLTSIGSKGIDTSQFDEVEDNE